MNSPARAPKLASAGERRPLPCRARRYWLGSRNRNPRQRRISGHAKASRVTDGWAPGNSQDANGRRCYSTSAEAWNSLDITISAPHGGRGVDRNDILGCFSSAQHLSRTSRQAADALRDDHAATPSATSSTATSTTRTSAASGASFAPSRKAAHRGLARLPYDLVIEEITRRANEAWDRGATEVCLQGGIHPAYTARHIYRFAARSKRSSPRCTSTHSRR